MLALLAASTPSFAVQRLGAPSSHAATYRAATSPFMAQRDPFSLSIDLPPKGKCALKFKPLLASSEAVVVKYGLPFGLNVEQQGDLAVCTKPGPGGEQPGDVLRYCTEWNIGLPGGPASISATQASFSGVGLSYQLGLCDVAKAESWDDVVQALTSNTQERTDYVMLVFERPTE